MKDQSYRGFGVDENEKTILRKILILIQVKILSIDKLKLIIGKRINIGGALKISKYFKKIINK